MRCAARSSPRDSGAFDRYHRAAFRAAWADGRDINEREVVGTLLAEALGSSEATALEAIERADRQGSAP
jgi:2-hydroxychromene-2-carboxylate isomerase